MKNITDYGIVIIDKEGREFDYIRELGHLHQEALDQYSMMKGYNTSNGPELASRMGDAVFYTFDRKTVYGFLPKDVNKEQKNGLEELSYGMDSLELLAIRKFMDEGYQEFKLRENVGEKFLTEVLPSYHLESHTHKNK